MTAQLRPQPEIYGLDAVEFLKRTDAMREAIASAEIEGVKVNDDTKDLMERYCVGEISPDEMMAGVHEIYGRRA